MLRLAFLVLFTVPVLLAGLDICSRWEECTVYRSLTSETEGKTAEEAKDVLNQIRQQSDPEQSGVVNIEYVVSGELLDHLLEVEGFKSGIEEKIENLKKQEAVSIFGTDDEKSELRADTLQYLDGLKDLTLPLISGRGMQKAVNEKRSGIFTAFLIVFEILILLVKEKQDGMLDFLKSTPVSEKRLSVSRTAAVFLSSAVFFLTLKTAMFLIYGAAYGFVNRKTPVQAVDGFINCPFQLTFRQAVLGMLLLSVLGLLVLTVLASWLGHLAGKTAAYLITALGAGLVLFLGAVKISDSSYLVLLKYWNPFGLLFSGRFVSDRLRFKLLGAYRNGITGSVIWALLTVILFAAWTLFLAVRRSESVFPKKKRSLRLRFRHLFIQELWKNWICRRGLLFLGGGLLAMWYLCSIFSYYPSSEEMHYRTYMNCYGGEWGEEKDRELKQEELRFSELYNQQRELNSLYSEGNMDENSYLLKSNEIAMQLELEPAFRRLSEAVEEMKERNASCLVYEGGYEVLLSDRPLLFYLMTLTAVIVFVGIKADEMFSEKGSMIGGLLRSTPKGRSERLANSFLIDFMAVFILGTAEKLLELAYTGRYYGLPYIFRGSNCLRVLSFAGKVPIAVTLLVFSLSEFFMIGFALFLFDRFLTSRG